MKKIIVMMFVMIFVSISAYGEMTPEKAQKVIKNLNLDWSKAKVVDERNEKGYGAVTEFLPNAMRMVFYKDSYDKFRKGMQDAVLGNREMVKKYSENVYLDCVEVAGKDNFPIMIMIQEDYGVALRRGETMVNWSSATFPYYIQIHDNIMVCDEID